MRTPRRGFTSRCPEAPVSASGSEANIFAAAAIAECKALRRASPAGGVLGGVRPRLVVQGDECAHGRVAQRGERPREGLVGLGAHEHALDAQPRDVRVALGLG